MVSGWRVLLKLYFQVFIVLSSADEAWPAVCTRVREGDGELVGDGKDHLQVPKLSVSRCCSPSLVGVVLESPSR